MLLPRVWNHHDDPNFGLADLLSQKIDARVARNPTFLSDVRSSRELLLACDFGGEHKGARYRSYSFLVGAISDSAQWAELRQHVRAHMIRDERRMSYKALGDAVRARCLLPFLRAADHLPGVLATFLIDKRITRLVGDHRSPNVFPELVVAEHSWNQNAFHKLCLVASLGSLLIRGLSEPTQDILWVTDQDEIAPNPAKHDHAGHVIHHHIATYAPKNTGTLVFITTEADLNARRLEDVVAIPDLSAGALGEVLSMTKDRIGRGISRIWIPFPGDLPDKGKTIATWFFNPTRRLSKLAIVIEPREDGEITADIVSALRMDGVVV
ncbi:MAG: hypothetical protein GY854_29755 [Deltaproteobacteria bacterium]|nr:hypothetical protein [Deltaproteobacteria bacterium]